MSDEKKEPIKESKAGKERQIALRAGVFVALALVLGAGIIMWVGKERQLFERHVRYRAAFENVEGLKRDSPVWLGGLEVGRVSSITFFPDLGDKRIEVQLEISLRYAKRVRKDSIARLSGRGILGDKAIDISIGSSDSDELEAGNFIPVGSSGDITSLMKSAGKVVDDAVAISGSLRTAVSAYADPALAKDVAGGIKSLRGIIDEVRSGNGAVHALVFDARTGDEVKGLIRTAQQATNRIDVAMNHVEAILAEVHTGQGGAHALIYDKKGAEAIQDVGRAAEEIAGLVRDAKTSRNGAIHQLVYGDASGMFADLGQASKDLKKITGTVARGEGTVGAFIQDPSIYEDIKTILGNVKRNHVLRSLVRLTISNGEELDQGGKPEAVPKK